MNRLKAIGLVLILIPAVGLAQKKSKKHNDVPAVFQNAQYIFVESMNGDAFKPGLYPEDRQAIYNVEDGVRDWHRYALATRRSEADVVLVVRKGRVAGAQARAGIGVGSRPPGSVSLGHPAGLGDQDAGQPAGPGGNADSVGGEAEVGPANDMLRVYLVSNDGKLTGPVWTRELQDGLDAPTVALLQQLKTAVERAYPSQPPVAKQTTP